MCLNHTAHALGIARAAGGDYPPGRAGDGDRAGMAAGSSGARSNVNLSPARDWVRRLYDAKWLEIGLCVNDNVGKVWGKPGWGGLLRRASGFDSRRGRP